ncbi:hypothetical protein [Neisseria musculi]
MKNKFLLGQWVFLKNLYGENVFDKYEIYVDNVYFQKWINPSGIKGYIINIEIKIVAPPENVIKNWEGTQSTNLVLGFYGDFGLGHFPMRNRNLLKLKGKRVRFNINLQPEETYPEIKVILPDSEICFRTAVLNIMGISANRSPHEP